MSTATARHSIHSTSSPRKRNIGTPHSQKSQLTEHQSSDDSAEFSSEEGIDETDRSVPCNEDNISTKVRHHRGNEKCLDKKLYPNEHALRKHSGSSPVAPTRPRYGWKYPDRIESEKPNHLPSHGGYPPFILIGFVFLVILSIFCLWYFLSTEVPKVGQAKPSLSNVWLHLKNGLHELRHKMKQIDHFWVQVFSQLQRLTEEDPLQPSVLLALVPVDSRKTAACLSQQILNIVSDAFGDPKPLSFDSQSHLKENYVTLKHSLDNKLQELNRSHAAAIYNLEKLPPEVMMILHAYCDTDSAPYKRALFILTLEVDFPSFDLDTRNLESVVEKLLLGLWENRLREVDAAAIISRITNAPVVITPESQTVVKKLCPI